MADRIIVVLPDDASDEERHAAVEMGAHVVMTRREFQAREPAPVGSMPAFTAAEKGVLTELAHRPDTRSRLASRLGITTSTLDNHVANIKRKVLEQFEMDGGGPADGYLSMEALIGWAMRQGSFQKS